MNKKKRKKACYKTAMNELTKYWYKALLKKSEWIFMSYYNNQWRIQRKKREGQEHCPTRYYSLHLFVLKYHILCVRLCVCVGEGGCMHARLDFSLLLLFFS